MVSTIQNANTIAKNFFFMLSVLPLFLLHFFFFGFVRKKRSVIPRRRKHRPNTGRSFISLYSSIRAASALPPKEKSAYNEIQIFMRTCRSQMNAAPQAAFVLIPEISPTDILTIIKGLTRKRAMKLFRSFAPRQSTVLSFN